MPSPTRGGDGGGVGGRKIRDPTAKKQKTGRSRILLLVIVGTKEAIRHHCLSPDQTHLRH